LHDIKEKQQYFRTAAFLFYNVPNRSESDLLDSLLIGLDDFCDSQLWNNTLSPIPGFARRA